MNYYNKIACGYDELYEEEQLKKLRFIASLLNNKRLTASRKRIFRKQILDVGCGTGITTNFFGCGIGIDPSEAMLGIARKRYPKIKFLNARAENLPFSDNSFDAVISITAIQNFSDIEKGLKEIKRVGKKFFILTFLKKSQKRGFIERLIKNLFKVEKRAEEDKDIIFICSK